MTHSYTEKKTSFTDCHPIQNHAIRKNR